MINGFMKTAPWCLSAAMLVSCSGSSRSDLEAAQQIIAEVREMYAPDSRIAVFAIEAEQTSQGLILYGETTLAQARTGLLAKLSEKNLTASDSITVLPHSDLGSQVYALVNVSVANIRKGNWHGTELVTQALLGTLVKVLKYDHDGWYLVQTPDAYLGWIPASGITRINAAQKQKWCDSEKIIFWDHTGLAYANPEITSPVVGDLVSGCILRVTGSNRRFYQVEYPQGLTAWVLKSGARSYREWLQAGPPIPATLVETGRSFTGFPYLWGGASSKAMDCSGFTRTVYYLHGIILPRDASQQALVGESVDPGSDFSGLLPGDLVFFGRAATDSTRERITHVGMVTGDREYIHSSGRVKVNSFDPERSNFNSYRYRSFVRATRILSPAGLATVTLVPDSPAYVCNGS